MLFIIVNNDIVGGHAELIAAVKDFSSIVLPPELDTWQERNRHVISHIHGALNQAEAPMTEEQLWNLIARSYSPAWAHARSQLTEAEQKINIHKSHENRALGAIGMALESDSINKELALHDTALALFTIVDEELHQDGALQKLLKVLVEDQRLLEESIRISRGILDITAAFGEVASPADSVSVSYTTPLQKAFSSMAKKLFKKKSPAKTKLDNEG